MCVYTLHIHVYTLCIHVYTLCIDLYTHIHIYVCVDTHTCMVLDKFFAYLTYLSKFKIQIKY